MKPLLLAALVGLCAVAGIVRLRTAGTSPEVEAAEADALLKKRQAEGVARAEANQAEAAARAELQRLIADVYHVETSRFIQPDVLWITAPPGTDLQKTCQAIANLWAHRSGLNDVSVESWSGGTRLAKATVQNQQFVTPGC